MEACWTSDFHVSETTSFSTSTAVPGIKTLEFLLIRRMVAAACTATRPEEKNNVQRVPTSPPNFRFVLSTISFSEIHNC
jgi:hypothetical protein